MPDDHPTTNFHNWLRPLLNSVAESCASYSSYAQESPPDAASDVHHTLLAAWDAYNIVVLLDKRYRTSSELEQFLSLNQLAPTDTFEQRVELLDRYYEQASDADPDAPEYAQRRAVLMAEVRKVFNGTGTGEMISAIFDSAFKEDGEESEDEVTDDEPAALIYIYGEGWAARAAYNGEQPPFDRAEEIRLVRWNPLEEHEKEVLRDIIETQRGADGHLDASLAEIMEKLA